MAEMQTWEVWYPEAAATGLLVARGRLDPTEVLWLHAAPPTLAGTVRDAADRLVARGAQPSREASRRKKYAITTVPTTPQMIQKNA